MDTRQTACAVERSGALDCRRGVSGAGGWRDRGGGLGAYGGRLHRPHPLHRALVLRCRQPCRRGWHGGPGGGGLGAASVGRMGAKRNPGAGGGWQEAGDEGAGGRRVPWRRTWQYNKRSGRGSWRLVRSVVGGHMARYTGTIIISRRAKIRATPDLGHLVLGRKGFPYRKGLPFYMTFEPGEGLGMGFGTLQRGSRRPAMRNVGHGGTWVMATSNGVVGGGG
jgi:hypothetical protein